MKKTRLVLEGGALRGLFTAGVLDVMLENNINIDEIIGVSAGALFGVNYFSKQIGRVIRYNKKYCGDKRYMSTRSLLLTGNYINKDFAFYKVTNELDKFNNKEFIKSKKNYYAVVTNVESGQAEYLKVESIPKDLEILRASSAMPFASKIIKIDNKKYLDGGISDSIPINYNKDKYNKSIIILTQPLDYIKKPLTKSKEIMVKLKFYKYPKLINTMLNRYKKYNETIEQIKELENKKEIFVIRPSKRIYIKLKETNPESYQKIYDMGVNTGKKIIKDLKKYLNS